MDVSKIDGMLAQLRAGAAVAAGKTAPVMTPSDTREAYGTDVVDFTTVLKNSLNQVNNSQQHAAKLMQDFEMGAQGANLTEAMISMQKATISLQYTVQVRNKIVMAYQDIMNMPV
jgi:flagellar hook-basal body complex protein FliE